jgi:phosphoadenosine phosphosulfate reductase
MKNFVKGGKKMNENFEKMSAEEIIKWALQKYGDKVALASSFGAEDVILIDMLVKIYRSMFNVQRSTNNQPRIFTLDTGRLPQETYDVMDRIREKYNVEIKVFYPDARAVEDIVEKYGFNLFYKSIELRQLCCRIRKVEPLNRAFKELNLDAWICGLRREQSVTRAEIKKIEYELRTTNNEQRTIVKISPLADWTEKQVWDYIKKNNVPYNTLHDKGYPSIGCAPCTRSVRKIEDIRAGRWWWEEPDKKECGLHTKK